VTLQAKTIQAVLFDFSGTLFRLEQDDRWLANLTESNGEPLSSQTRTELLRQMAVPSGDNVALNEEHRLAWETRDLDPQQHQKVYLELIRQSGVANPEHAAALYSRIPDPSQWTPYPDAEAALKLVKAQGLKIAVISNIPFDLRPAFKAIGLDKYIDEFVLSFEVGVIKPSPAIFQLTLEKLGTEPQHALMIGDNRHDDGGAMVLGCAFELVDPLPTAKRQNGLLTALKAHNIAER